MAMLIYSRLQEEFGFGGSYSSVRRYVSGKKLGIKLASEGYFPWLNLRAGMDRQISGKAYTTMARGKSESAMLWSCRFPNPERGTYNFSHRKIRNIC